MCLAIKVYSESIVDISFPQLFPVLATIFNIYMSFRQIHETLKSSYWLISDKIWLLFKSKLVINIIICFFHVLVSLYYLEAYIEIHVEECYHQSSKETFYFSMIFQPKVRILRMVPLSTSIDNRRTHVFLDSLYYSINEYFYFYINTLFYLLYLYNRFWELLIHPDGIEVA